MLRDNWSFGLEERDERVFAFRNLGQDSPSVAEIEDSLQKQLAAIRSA